MRDLKLPRTLEEWDALPPRIVRANLQLAGMSYVDLAVALSMIGVRQDNKLISSRLRLGRFSATFFVQALAVAGVDHLRLPVVRGPSDQRRF